MTRRSIFPPFDINAPMPRATHSGYVPSGVTAEPPAFVPRQPSSIVTPAAAEAMRRDAARMDGTAAAPRTVASLAELRAVIACARPDTLVLLPAKIVAELLERAGEGPDGLSERGA